jgi:DNA transposition AAA+ family ATPase
MSSVSRSAGFIITQEYRRFAELCEACQRDCYIGLCYGPPGVGKTLSARHYAHWDTVTAAPLATQVSDATLAELVTRTTVIYTPPVVTSPGRLEREIQQWRHTLRAFHWEALHREEAVQLAEARQREVDRWRQGLRGRRVLGVPIVTPARVATPLAQIATTYAHQRQATPDPTRLIIIDEADRLKTAGFEQVRDIFDRGELGVVLIGMPGLEKRLARYPQLYSRVGFVHAFRALSPTAVHQLLQDQWRPAGVTLPAHSLTDEEVLAAILRMTGGNFRLLQRLLTQIARIVAINGLQTVTPQVVDTARDILVIGMT